MLNQEFIFNQQLSFPFESHLNLCSLKISLISRQMCLSIHPLGVILMESPSLTIVTFLILFPRLFTKFTLVPACLIKSRYLSAPKPRSTLAASILMYWRVLG